MSATFSPALVLLQRRDNLLFGVFFFGMSNLLVLRSEDLNRLRYSSFDWQQFLGFGPGFRFCGREATFSAVTRRRTVVRGESTVSPRHAHRRFTPPTKMMRTWGA